MTGGWATSCVFRFILPSQSLLHGRLFVDRVHLCVGVYLRT